MIFKRSKGNGAEINLKLKFYAETEKNTHFFDPFDAFCNNDSCYALDNGNDKIWYSDGGHVSIDGSLKTVNYFTQELISIIRE